MKRVGQPKEDLTHKTFNDWYVLNYAGNGKWLCECSCGNVRREIRTTALTSGHTKSCGHNTNARKDWIGMEFNDWTVIGYGKTGYLKCRCKCNNVREVYIGSLTSGKSISCGHAKKTLTMPHDKYGEWEVLRKVGTSETNGGIIWRCRCSCGNESDVLGTALRNGDSTSCGHPQYPFTSEELFETYVLDLVNRLNRKPTIFDISEDLNMSYSAVEKQLRHVEKGKCLLEFNSNVSNFELQIYEFAKQYYPNAEQHNRSIIAPLELDIYIPELSIAIECNGTYWHNDEHKPVKYHLDKTNLANTKNIRLIHIFEYEWLNNKDKILNYLKQQLDIDQTTIYARNCELREISNTVANEFLNLYHLQDGVYSESAYGLFHNNTLVEVMTFGRPRFNTLYDTELLRLCTKSGYKVIGGASKLFKYYVETHKNETIISYCNLAKFTGNVYSSIGMTYKGTTNPNYVYVAPNNTKILSRYSCRKDILVKQGFNESLTEAEIMRQRGFNKIYDCGNAVYSYIKQ